jgi:hypothetical protein
MFNGKKALHALFTGSEQLDASSEVFLHGGLSSPLFTTGFPRRPPDIHAPNVLSTRSAYRYTIPTPMLTPLVLHHAPPVRELDMVCGTAFATKKWATRERELFSQLIDQGKV